MANPISEKDEGATKDPLQLSYGELEELNLAAREQRAIGVPAGRQERLKYLAEQSDPTD